MTYKERKALRVWRSQRRWVPRTHRVRSLYQARSFDRAHGFAFAYDGRGTYGLTWGRSTSTSPIWKSERASSIASAKMAVVEERRSSKSKDARNIPQSSSLKEDISKALGLNPRFTRLGRWGKSIVLWSSNRPGNWKEYASVSIGRRSVLVEVLQ